MQNEEDRHRVKIQTHTQNTQQMPSRASQVTFVKKMYIKYYFIGETVVECYQSAVRTTNPFWQLLPKEEDLPFRERIRLPVWEESPPFGKQKI